MYVILSVSWTSVWKFHYALICQQLRIASLAFPVIEDAMGRYYKIVPSSNLCNQLPLALASDFAKVAIPIIAHNGEVHDLAVCSLVRRRCIDCKVSCAGTSFAPASSDQFKNARKHCTKFKCRRARRSGPRNHTRALAEAGQPGRNLLACDLTLQAKKNTEQFDRDFRLASLQDITQPVEISLFGVLKDGDTALLVDGWVSYSEIRTTPIQSTG